MPQQVMQQRMPQGPPRGPAPFRGVSQAMPPGIQSVPTVVQGIQPKLITLQNPNTAMNMQAAAYTPVKRERAQSM